MTGLLKGVLVKFVRARWGSILPALFKAAAEGQFGPAVQKAYWWTAGYRTFIGAVLLGVGAGLETVCASYPDLTWACPAARYVYIAGGVLTAVGLADGGTRAPWPTTPSGAASWQHDKV
jgi:hypothetical protein